VSATITHEDVQGTLQRLKEEDPGLRRLLKSAYGYAIFPSVGKAAAVVGGAFGRGEVFERGKRIGHATLSQLTIGVQLGGETFAEIIVFENQQTLDRLKQGKFAFAANASAALVRAGAAASAGFEKGARAFVYSDGGMMLEAAIGGQKFKFKPASDDEHDEDQSRGESAQEPEDQGIAQRAMTGIRDAASSATDLIKRHPVAAGVVGAGVLAGVTVLAVRAMRNTSANAADSGQDEDSDQESNSESEAQ